MHQRLQVVADGIDMHVLVDQLNGLGAQGVPEQLAVAAGRLDRLVNLRQPAVVRLRTARGTGSGDIASQSLPSDRIVGRESIPHLVVRQALLRGDQPLVPADGPVHAGEEGQALLHRLGQLRLQLVHVGDDLLDALLVKVQRLRHVVEDAEVVDDQPVRLLSGTVRFVRQMAWSRLWSRMGLSRYITWRMGASKPVSSFDGHDQELQRVARIAEPVQQLLFLVPAGRTACRARAGRLPDA